MPDNPFYYDLTQIQPNQEDYSPSAQELLEKKQDEEQINLMLDYRSQFEPQWVRAARAWNLLSEPIKDPRVSNILIPIIRMIASTAISNLREGMPGYGYRPGSEEDYPKVELWKAADLYVDMQTNMSAVMDQFITDYTIFGTGILEDFVQTPQRTLREEGEGGALTEITGVRDWRRPKVGTRARTPYECGIHPGGRTHDECPSVFFCDRMPYDVFVQNYARVYIPGTIKPKYDNCQYVKPGKVWDFSRDGQIILRESDYPGVLVMTYQDQVRDILRIYANGVRILNTSLRKANILGETTLAFCPNNSVLDSNLRTHALWGAGDPHLLRGLDILYQCFANMTVDNWKLANSVVISVKSLSNPVLDLDQQNFYSGMVIDGEVITSPLGQVNLSSYQAFKEILDEWCIWTTGVNFKQLVGETSKTAFELQQRIRAGNKRYESKIRGMEAGGLLKHGRLRLANIMNDLTVPEFERISEKELPDIKKRLQGKKTPGEDVIIDEATKEPTYRKVYTKIRVPGRVFREEFGEDGKRHINKLYEDKDLRGKQDGYVPAVGEYLWSQEYIERKGIPDVYVVGKQMLGDMLELKMDKMNLLSQYARARVTEAAQMPDNKQLETTFDLQKIDRELIRAADIPEDEVTTKQPDSQIDPKQILKQAQSILTTPSPNAALPPQSPLPPLNPARPGAVPGATGGPQAPQQDPAAGGA